MNLFTSTLRFMAVSTIFFSTQRSDALPLGLCKRFLFEVRKEAIVRKNSSEQGKVFHWIYQPRAFLHPKRSVRSLAWEVFKDMRVSDGLKEHIGNRFLPEDFEFLLLKLKSLNTGQRQGVLASDQSFKDWWEKIQLTKSEKSSVAAVKYVEVEGQPVEAAFYEKVKKMQENLTALGVQTHFQPAQNIATLNGVRKGRGLLIIDTVQINGHESLQLARTKIFDSPEFLEYLEYSRANGGVIAIDPDIVGSLTGAYFAQSKYFLDGADWVVAVTPSTMASFFLHEWQHVKDAMAEAGESSDSAIDSLDSQTKPLVTAALKNAALAIERRLYSELNATKVQLDIHKNSPLRRFLSFDFLNTVLYRGLNQQEVGAARVFLEPKGLKHYYLLLKGTLNFYLPLYVFSKAMTPIETIEQVLYLLGIQ